MEYLNQSGISPIRDTRIKDFYPESESRNLTRAQLPINAGKHRHWHALLRCAWLKRDVMLGRKSCYDMKIFARCMGDLLVYLAGSNF
jgi:hypothetical protein